MIGNSRTAEIKRSQKESLFLREISQLFMELSADQPVLQGLVISRTKFSADKSVCMVFFYSPHGIKIFEEKLKTLTLFKPSLRKALAHRIKGRYTPDLVFMYDAQLEKQQELEELIESIKE